MNEQPERKHWPVDPAQYPLSGPSHGPVYLPDAEALEQRMKRDTVTRLWADTGRKRPLPRMAKVVIGLIIFGWLCVIVSAASNAW